MSVNLRGKKWVVSLGSGRDRIRQTFDTQAQAVQYEQSIVMKKYQQETAPTNGLTLDALKTLTTKAIWSQSKSAVKLEANAQLCIDHLGVDLLVSEVNAEKLRSLVNHFLEQGNAGGTVNRKMSTMSVMLDYALEQGYIQSAPKVPRRKEASHRIRFYTPEEEQALLSYCEQRGLRQLADFIVVAIDTGFRRKELLSLRVADCESTYAILHAGTTKSGKARSVPLTKRVRAVVEARKQLGYVKLFSDMTDYQLRKLWEDMIFNLGITDPQFIVHTLRHTCASRLAQAGKNATFIMNWMGHSSIMVTQRYMHLAPRTLEEGIEALEGFQKAA